MDASARGNPGGGEGSSEDDLSWLLSTAHHFLSSIKTGAESEFGDGLEEGSRRREEQSLSEAESALVPALAKRPPSPITAVPGLLWRPSTEAPETVIFVTSSKRAPLLVTSFIGYQEAGMRRRRRQSVDTPAMFLRPLGGATGKAQSYAHLLGASDTSSSSSSSASGTSTPADHSHPVSSSSTSTSASSSSSTSTSDHFTSTDTESTSSDTDSSASSDDSVQPYDPCFLDDPELRTGKHKTVIALPGYLGSLVHFIRAEDLKKELNDQFRQIHPSLEPSLTLSKIRKLKVYLVKAAEQAGLELSTVAKAFTFFEKLVLKGLVGKANRKLVGATCLLLATKANDSKDVRMPALFHALAEHLEASKPEVLAAEFPVLAALEFDLFPAQQEYLPHLERILTSLDYSNIQEYLGERMYTVWKRDVN